MKRHLAKRAALGVAASTIVFGVAACSAPPPNALPSSASATAPSVTPVPSASGSVTASPSPPPPPPPSPSATSTTDRDPVVWVQSDLLRPLPETVTYPALPADLVQEVGDVSARNGLDTAVALAQAVTFIPGLWDPNRIDPTPAPGEIEQMNRFMAQEPAEKWILETNSSQELEKNLMKVSKLVVLPEPLPEGGRWLYPALRNWQFTNIKVARGEPYGNTSYPTMMVSLTINGVGAYELGGKFYEFNLQRDLAFRLVKSINPEREWLLVSWASKPPVFSSVVESPNLPAGTQQIPYVDAGPSDAPSGG